MRKSTVLLVLGALVFMASITHCDVKITADSYDESCGTIEQCEELERLKAMPEFQAARSPASMQP